MALTGRIMSKKGSVKLPTVGVFMKPLKTIEEETEDQQKKSKMSCLVLQPTELRKKPMTKRTLRMRRKSPPRAEDSPKETRILDSVTSPS